MTFADRLAVALDARGSLCVGVDPHPALLTSWGLSEDVDGLMRFADLCVEAFADATAVVKPQSAFFEVFGSAGMAVLERMVRAFRAAGALVLLDVKRGDIGSTMAAYARAYLDPSSPLAADAMTLSPYLGVGSLQPAFDLVDKYEVGAFVLAFTSNPEGAHIQRAMASAASNVGDLVLSEVGRRNDRAGHNSVGAVVGATIGAVDLGDFTGPLLVPGIGAQGGTPDDVRRVFSAAAGIVLPTTSRDVLRHGPDVAALRSAAARTVAEFAFLRP